MKPCWISYSLKKKLQRVCHKVVDLYTFNILFNKLTDIVIPNTGSMTQWKGSTHKKKRETKKCKVELRKINIVQNTIGLQKKKMGQYLATGADKKKSIERLFFFTLVGKHKRTMKKQATTFLLSLQILGLPRCNYNCYRTQLPTPWQRRQSCNDDGLINSYSSSISSWLTCQRGM